MSAAETILRAAELMDQHALLAAKNNRGWDAAVDDMAVTVSLAGHVGGMTPDVGLAVAAWLQSCGAELRDSGDFSSCDEPGSIKVALRIAQTYLQEVAS